MVVAGIAHQVTSNFIKREWAAAACAKAGAAAGISFAASPAVSFLLIFACLLLAAVLVSAAAERSVLSSAVIFLAGGVLFGREVLGLLDIGPDEPGIGLLAELALFSVLFTDGARVRLPDMRPVWMLPSRALLVGMPLTFAGIALLSRILLRLDWQQAVLIGAVLSPTDPVKRACAVPRSASTAPALV